MKISEAIRSMKKVKVIVERGSDNKFSAIMDCYDYDFGLSGFGDTPKEAIADFYECYDEAKVMNANEGKSTPELDFDFEYDLSSFLNYYSGILSKSGLQQITGVSQKQLWHYSSGSKRPRLQTTRKIEESVHQFANDLRQVRFY